MESCNGVVMRVRQMCGVGFGMCGCVLFLLGSAGVVCECGVWCVMSESGEVFVC